MITFRDAAVRYVNGRATVEEVEEASIEAGRLMKLDGLTLEEILVLPKGAVVLAVEHANGPAASERAASLRAQITPWLIETYVRETGDFTQTKDQ